MSDPIIDLHSDDYFMGEALRQAAKAYEKDEVPVGAVIVRAGRIIARAYNQVEELKDATADFINKIVSNKIKGIDCKKPVGFYATVSEGADSAVLLVPVSGEMAFVDLLGTIAKKKNATPAQIALAWLLAQKPWIVPIPGTTKLPRLEENIGAVTVDLTSDDLKEIDSAASTITAQGNRYPEQLEKLTGR